MSDGRSASPRRRLISASICPHFLVGDDQEIAAAAGGVEDADAGEAVAQVQQLAAALSPSPASSSFCAQVVEEERVEHLEDVRHAGVVHAQGAAFLVVGDGLDHRAEDVGVDLLPVEPADEEQVGAGDLAEPRRFDAAGEEAAVDVGELIGPGAECRRLRGRPFGVFMARNSSASTSCVFEPSRAVICSMVAVNRRRAVEDTGVFGEEAEDQPGEEVVEVLAAGVRVPVGVVP